MTQSDAESQQFELEPWDPEQLLSTREPHEIRYSMGFLQSKPENWFPGLGAHWLPLAHSMGIELKVVQVQPTFTQPEHDTLGFVASVDDEPIALVAESESIYRFLETVVPSARGTAGSIVAEYFARRFISSLALCWSGPDSSVVRFEPELNPADVRSFASILFDIQLNGVSCRFWLQMGRVLVERLDGLWRRQVKSSTSLNLKPAPVQIEIAQLAVSAHLISDYTKPGTIIDLEVPVTDEVRIASKDDMSLEARLVNVDKAFVLEILRAAPVPVEIPADSVRLQVLLGSFSPIGVSLKELLSGKTMLETGLPLGNEVLLSIGGETVAKGQLSIFQGRFAVTVLA